MGKRPSFVNCTEERIFRSPYCRDKAPPAMEALLKQDQALPPEERARITEIQDLLIDRFVEHREATEKGQAWRAKELEAEIEELQNEKENVAKWAAVGSA